MMSMRTQSRHRFGPPFHLSHLSLVIHKYVLYTPDNLPRKIKMRVSKKSVHGSNEEIIRSGIIDGMWDPRSDTQHRPRVWSGLEVRGELGPKLVCGEQGQVSVANLTWPIQS